MREYIKESSKRYKIQNLKFYDKPVYVMKPITNNVDLEKVLADIESKVPKYLTDNISKYKDWLA